MATYNNIASNILLKFLVVATVMATMMAIPAWADNDKGKSKTTLPELTDIEVEHLTFVREEEKMARDVYQFMYDKWGANIFNNIVASEQRHMDTMLKMVDKYGLDDPAADENGEINDYGVFTNQDIQSLYDKLVAQGDGSYVEALKVGVFIEEFDIDDITMAINDTDPDHVDLVTAYENLMEGSKNHLAAFCDDLDRQGLTCEATVIDSSLFDAIIDIY